MIWFCRLQILEVCFLHFWNSGYSGLGHSSELQLLHFITNLFWELELSKRWDLSGVLKVFDDFVDEKNGGLALDLKCVIREDIWVLVFHFLALLFYLCLYFLLLCCYLCCCSILFTFLSTYFEGFIFNYCKRKLFGLRNGCREIVLVLLRTLNPRTLASH